MPCTTILVGRNASFDGSTLMARNEDSAGGSFNPKSFRVVLPDEQPRHYKSVISGVEIELPDTPMRYTCMPNALPDEGIWGAAGVNEANVAMTATETLTSNPRVLGADPLVPGGIGEEDLVTLTLPYVRSAREAVLRLGALHERYGTYEINGIGLQDPNELWWFETIGGHHWAARRVPDDSYIVMPNQQGIDSFDLADAFGAQEEHLCSSDLPRISKTRSSASVFDMRGAFGSRADADHCYNTPRAWFMLRTLNPNTCAWDGEYARYTPESDDLPWCLVPERKITVEDIKYVLSAHYQGTPFDPYARHGDPSRRGQYRPIGINRNNVLVLTQLRPYAPADCMAVEWIALGSNVFNAIAPFYANVTRTPEYLACTGKTVSTESFYWVNRLMGALADAHLPACAQHIERYQDKVARLGHEMLARFDREMPAEGGAEYLSRCNDELAAMLRRETEDALDKVLYAASMGMKNSFSRADA